MEFSPTYPDLPDPRVIILGGYGVSLTTHRGHLVANDGYGQHRRERRFSRLDARGPDGLARIVILARTGYVSLEAMEWTRALGIGVIQLDHDGTVLLTSPGLSGDPRVRRTQMLAAPDGPYAATGAAIVRELLQAKVDGQGTNLSLLGHPGRTMLTIPDDPIRMIGVEGRIANTYWQAWRDSVFTPFRPEDLKDVPTHWYGFPGRRSGIKGDNRRASDPVNALLNYSYAICLTEAIYACQSLGLDPDFGLSHGEHEGKPSMALDLAEPLRPIADRVVLSMLDHGHGIPMGNDGKPAYLPRASFREQPDGTVRISAPVSHELAASVSMAVAYEAGRIAETIVRKFINVSGTTSVQQDTKPITTDPRFKPREKPRQTLHRDVKPSELLPDHVWERVIPLIPVSVGRSSGAQRMDNRIVLAGIIASEIYEVPWSALPPELGSSRRTCKRRLEEWKALGVWSAIRSEITRPGVSQSAAS